MMRTYSHSLFKVVSLILITFFLLTHQAYAITNTQSLDLEESSGQYASITDGSQAGLDITGDITMEAWIKIESLSNDYYAVIGKGDFFYDAGYVLTIQKWDTNDYRIRSQVCQTANCSTSSNTTGTTNLYNYIGTWVHVAATWEAGSSNEVKLYVDGVQESTEAGPTFTGASSIRNNSNPLHVGANKYNSTVGAKFDGLIDEVRIWNDVRSSTEINDNMLVSLVGNESNLVAYWDFNNNDDDKTSNNNDLTLVNAPSYSEEPAHLLMCSFSGLF